MELELGGGCRPQQSDSSHTVEYLRGEAVGQKREDIGSSRVANQQRVRLLPRSKIMPQYPLEIPRCLFRCAACPEVAQRVQTHRGNPLAGEGTGKLAVNAGPTSISRQDHCECLLCR